MNQMELVRFFMSASDADIQRFMRKKTGIELSLQEIQQLRPLLAGANMSWLLSGVPKDVLKRVDKVIGKEKRKQLMNLLN
ncbi:isopropylmalate synthase [Metasolibacillus meyeri]|uniref:Isopropylmalate synthase n=1 Tax=Metasolibacillus meyeri TaxID=1071052 RepID=A0AAW9NVQ5_9BACL|nr:isopropylmalate synthase [Metasolibacillus meyeri]MEC1179975.1 isopropylmalate synthase [Metasolibacillus meyeri]